MTGLSYKNIKKLRDDIYELIFKETRINGLNINISVEKSTDMFIKRYCDRCIVMDIKTEYKKHGEITLTFSIGITENPFIYIDTAYFDEQYRSKGIGTKIIKILIDYINDNNMSKRIIIADRSESIGQGETIWSRIFKKFPDIEFIVY